MKNMKRSVALLVAIALLIGCVAGGTIAWLVDTTGNVTNTFVAGNIDITLDESKLKDDGTLDIVFIEKQRAVTEGQYVVFYNDTMCLGGGVIDKVIKE